MEQSDALALAVYAADGRQDIAVFRRSTGVCWITRSSDGLHPAIQYGRFLDFPSIGDYDGDGRSDFVARRNNNGAFQW